MQVSTHALCRQWPGAGGQPVDAVQDVSFTVGEGEIFGLLGPNGAGKSTIMRMISGLIPPTSGTASVCGVDVVRAPHLVRQHLGYLSATSGLPARLTCEEVLTLFAHLQECTEATVSVERAIERHGIAEFRRQAVETLSTGMRQRVRIACASVHQPPVLILDEPSAGLDVVAAAQMLETIAHERERGTSIIFSTHVLREAEKVCDRIGVLYEGRLRAVGTRDELLSQTGTDCLEDAFVALVQS